MDLVPRSPRILVHKHKEEIKVVSSLLRVAYTALKLTTKGACHVHTVSAWARGTISSTPRLRCEQFERLETNLSGCRSKRCTCSRCTAVYLLRTPCPSSRSYERTSACRSLHTRTESAGPQATSVRGCDSALCPPRARSQKQRAIPAAHSGE